ncbi:heavy metal translocating P-type ATPase [Methanobacterium alcaliphilum]|uniref:heavy metal translocating P-type ATPase n=1 Tax=Methanobacterium alcaliphilum TaxID=392018 RepID=UPI00200B0289|nr:cation-translocating P-type ATPase [Methanobacterium alcaliphilum]MCK9152073.1 cadmium-translocating P-type ATPase [Methanobacterium alcaliphilum]
MAQNDNDEKDLNSKNPHSCDCNESYNNINGGCEDYSSMNDENDEDCGCGNTSGKSCKTDNSSDFCSCGCGDDLFEEKEKDWKKTPLLIICSSILILSLGLYLDFFTSQKLLAELFFLVVVVLSGLEIIKKGLQGALKGKFTMNLLITIAVVGAFFIGEGAEGASVVFLFFLAEFLETYAGERARKSISNLLKLAPETATLKKNGESEEIPVNQVNINDIILVRPGDKIPLDGVVIKGKSSLDQATITGESMPVTKIEKDMVFAGTLNIDGFLEVKVTQRSNQTLISKIIQMVKESQSKKSKTEAFIDKFAHYYTPAVILLAVAVATIPPFLLGLPFDTWFYRALVLLVVSCPCALAISTPISMVSAITAGTNNGVLIKGGEYIEKMQDVDVFVFDKTGTLTEGNLEVTDIIPFNNFSEKELLGISAGLESNSKHPLAEAIVNQASNQKIPIKEVKDFESLTGEGLKGIIDGDTFFIGKKSLFHKNIDFPVEIVRKMESEGKTVVLVGNNYHIVGVIGLRDKIRLLSKKTITSLKNRNIKTLMLTGDNPGTAKAVASKIGMDKYHYSLLPQDKVKMVENLLKENKKVAMVGDGVNDAPVLALADVGIAMGAVGSDVAIEAADIALMQDDISKIDYLIDLSRKSMGVIKQNITVAIIIKSSFAILSVMGFVTLWMAVAIGDMGLSLAVILNALRIGRKRSKK